MNDQLSSLRQQLAEFEKNLRLIQERKAQYVLAEEIPLQLIKDEQACEEQIIGLKARIELLKNVDCPYRGLAPFEAEHAAYYFGREAMVTKLVEQVRRDSFVAVVGPSGSGKSSLVRAGLRHTLEQSSELWDIAMFTPGRYPLRALATRLVERLCPLANEIDHLVETDKLAGHLRDGTLILEHVLASVLEQRPGKSLLLLIDQFEELFTPDVDNPTRDRFIDLVLEAVALDRYVRVVLAMRADFYEYVLRHPRLGGVFDGRMFNVLPLSRTQSQDAIERPALEMGREFDPGLVERIVEDVGDEPGNLPLLQFALTELWGRQTPTGLLTHAAYGEIGGVEKALARYAQQIYDALSMDEQGQVQRIFTQMIRPGEGTADTRRLATRDEVGEKNWDLVMHLADKRLVVTRRELIVGAERRETAEVAHEALIRGWEQLQQWMNADRAFRTWQERLRAVLRQWEQSTQDQGALLRGAFLVEAEDWLTKRADDLSEREQVFIQSSIALREREKAEKEAANQRLRKLVVSLVVVLAVAVLAGLAAIVGFVRSNQRAAEAQNLALAAGAQAALSEGNTDLALALAMVANRQAAPVIQAQLTLAEAAYAPGTRRIFIGHQSGVQSVAFSPDGRTALSGSMDKTLILWDVATGQAIRHFTRHDDGVLSVAFSPDGKTALSGSLDTNVILWSVATGQAIRHFTGHTDEVNAVAFSPDGRTALSGSEDKTLILWDVATGQAVRHFARHTDGVLSVAFSPDGKTVLSGSEDKTLILWDVATGQVIRHFTGHTDGVTAIVFSLDGKTVLSGSEDKTLILWDVATGQAIRRFVGHTGEVNTVAFSPDGHTILSGSRDTSLRLWDVATGEHIRSLIGHSTIVTGVAFSPDGRTVLSGSGDHNLRLWDLASGVEIRHFVGHPDQEGHTDGVWRVAFSPDGHTILSGSEDKTLILWDVGTGRAIHRFTGHTSKVYGVAFSPDGRIALSGSGDKTLILWDITRGAKIRHFEGHTNWVMSAAFSPDGRTALSGSTDKTLILWDVATGQAIRRFTGHEGGVQSVAFSPDGKTVLSGSEDKTLILWDVATGQAIRRFIGHTAPVRDVAFSPDGKTALSGSTDKTLILWDVATGQAIRRFIGHNGAVFSVVFSSDGHTALSGSFDASLILWDVATGQAIRRFTGHTAPVRDVAFSPDGKTALSGSLDTTLRLWRIDSLDDLIAWTNANRYIPELTCDQRKLYRLEPLCDETGAPPTPTP